jgi:hypothetical protein
MILITTYYETENIARNNEIKKCLIKNFENKHIEKIYLLNNKMFDIDFIEDENNKIIQIIISDYEDYKLKYNDAIQFINKNLSNNICILSNSDIYFDKTLEKIDNNTISDNLFALLRYDEDIMGQKNIFCRHEIPRGDSQDSWIFKSPLNINLDKINFSLGTLGCDSMFASILNEEGIHLKNPAFDIITTHVHSSEFRTYNCDDRVHGNYCLVSPCHLDEESKISFMVY